MNEPKRKLMTLQEDGLARTPDELEGEAIHVLRSMETAMGDGRQTFKWVVRRASGETAIYWSAGQNPSLQVDQWFRDNVGVPLHCRLFRQVNKYGTSVWRIEQLEEDEHRDAQATRESALEAQLSEAGM